MRRSGPFLLALALAALLPALVTSTAGARPLEGRLDPTFGHGGVALSPHFRRVVENRLDVSAVEPDGDLIVGVQETLNEVEGDSSFSLVRLRPDGSRDPSFSSQTEVPPTTTTSQVVLPDGSALVLGASADQAQCASAPGAVRKLLPGGGADPTFGEDGCVPLPTRPTWIATQADGRIVLAGQREYASAKLTRLTELVLERLLPDGRVDSSFGGDGIVDTRTEAGVEGTQGEPLALSPAGEIFTTGAGVSGSTRIIAFAPDGRPDPGFGSAKGVEVPGTAPQLVLGAGGTLTILTAGNPSGASPSGLHATRFLPDGTPDPDFGIGGSVSIQVGKVDQLAGSGPEADGGLLIAAAVGSGTGCPSDCAYRPALVRLTSTGTLDPGYGNGGVVIPRAPEPPPIEAVELPGLAEPPKLSLLVGSDGKAYLSGGAYGRGGFLFAREDDGSPDLGFGERGVVRFLPTLPSDARPVALTLGSGGAIDVTAEGEPFRFGSESSVLRFRPDGTLGRSKSEPPVTVPVAPLLAFLRFTLPDGPDHFLGVAESELSPDRIVRFGPAGLAPRFGREGAIELPHGFTPVDLLHGLGRRLLVVGRFPGQTGYAVLALGRHGRPVGAYGDDGLVRLHLGPPHDTWVSSATVEPDGSVVLIGRLDDRAGAVRLLPGGDIDTNFGHAGRLKFLGLHAVATQAVRFGSELVIGCSREQGGNRHGSTLVALSSRGRIDREFGSRGHVAITSGLPPLAILRSGQDLVTVFAAPASAGGVRLRAYLADGNPDLRFGNDGTALVATGQRRPFRLIAATVQKDGKILVLGQVGDGAFRRQAEILRFR
jgi:uncharacterized delta-60 repeat protein